MKSNLQLSFLINFLLQSFLFVQIQDITFNHPHDVYIKLSKNETVDFMFSINKSYIDIMNNQIGMKVMFY